MTKRQTKEVTKILLDIETEDIKRYAEEYGDTNEITLREEKEINGMILLASNLGFLTSEEIDKYFEKKHKKGGK